MPTTPPGIHGVWPSYLEPMDTEVTTNRFDYNLQPPYTYISKNKGHLQSASYYGRKSLSADNFINKFINNFLQLNFSILYSYIKIPDWHCPGDRSCDRSGRFPHQPWFWRLLSRTRGPHRHTGQMLKNLLFYPRLTFLWSQQSLSNSWMMARTFWKH